MKFLFAWRYFKSKKSTNVINVIAWISVIAIAVGTAALIIVLSVFNGFEGLVKSLYGDFYADLRISPASGKIIHLSEAQLARIKAAKGIKALSLCVEQKAVLTNGDYQSIVFLKGVDANYPQVVNISKHIGYGKYELGTSDAPHIVLGSGVQNALATSPQNPSPLVIYLPNTDAENFSDLNSAMNSFEIAETGVFRIQEDFDNKYAFTNLPFLRYMLNLPDDAYSSVELKLQPRADPNQVKYNLGKLLGGNYLVQTRYEQNQGLFSVMQMEKWVIYAILSLILLIAAFNMIGALTMLVLEKRKDIAVLKAMGADNRLILGIFLYEGLLLALVGGIIGMLIALGVCYVQSRYHLIKLTGGSFLIDYYPVITSVYDFLLVGFTILVVAMLASWVPAKKASLQFYSLKS